MTTTNLTQNHKLFKEKTNHFYDLFQVYIKTSGVTEKGKLVSCDLLVGIGQILHLSVFFCFSHFENLM